MKKSLLFKKNSSFVPLMVLALLITCQLVYAQHQVSGRVTEADDPLPGVNVVEKGTTNGTVTDIDGNYTLTVPAEATLVFSYIGFTNEEVIVGGRDVVNVTMQIDVTSLQEVVVIGYGTIRKSDVTGAVAQIKTEDMQRLATSDVNLTLQGRAAGVQVIKDSGAPGSGSVVRIRGIGSLSDSNPIYIVDGFPTQDISNLLPSDIESVEVLKDASATAIYGSRGANGVILITTKRGNAGAVNFNVNAYYGATEVWQTLDVLNAEQYANLRLEAFANDGTTPDASTLAKLEFVRDNPGNGTDWQEEILEVGKVQNYALNVNGGKTESKFSLSANYFRLDGTVKGTFEEKVITRFNNDLQFNDWLTGGLNVSYAYQNFTNSVESQFGSPLSTAIRKDPITMAFDPGLGTYGRSGLSDVPNPLRQVDEGRERLRSNYRIQAGAFLTAEVVKGLKFTSRFTFDRIETDNDDFAPAFFINGNENRELSILTSFNSQRQSFVNSNFVNYLKEFGNHTIDATVGMELFSDRQDAVSVVILGAPEDESLRFNIQSNNQEDVQYSDGRFFQNKLFSYFARANYNYDDRYLVTATVRRDGSSKFADGNRWGTFPSFSAGWNAHNESFFPTSDIFSSLKVRAGWGEVGNETSVGSFDYLTLYNPNFNYVFSGDNTALGSAPTTIVNSNIQWETFRQINIGTDIGLFDDKLNATLDYFIKTTDDFLYVQPVPGIAGAEGGTANIGDMENKGFEIALGYRNSFGDLDVDLSLNASRIVNEVRSLGGGEPLEVGFESRSGGPNTITQEGEEAVIFYGLKTDGIFNSQQEIDTYTNSDGELIQPNAQPGDVKYIDVDGDGSINFANDRTNIGSPVPDLTLGFNAKLGYKGFDLSIFIQSSIGNDIANMAKFYSSSPSGLDNQFASRMNRWTAENPNANEPRMTVADPNQNFLYSDRYIEDGDYVRLKNLQLGYTLPQNLVNKMFASSIRVYVSSDNLITITDYSGFDPEVGPFQGNALHFGVDYGQYPQARTFMAGININF
ncbi:TonB-dependent receptor [Fulvivirga sp. M361]|uniref:SusC/RagA family TonB-linked outer membrane protein n=1 Tax=Fulvivirga sp. M361 TaxID=2594266 RepID=UPI00162ADA9F|nr:TonB-dependent receptor [Fulvivirga sp. M361]